MRCNKISNKAKWYIRTVTIILFLCALLVIYILKILFTKTININDYIPFNIDIILILKIISILLFIITILFVIFLPNIIYKNYGFLTDKYFFKIKSGIIFKTVSIVLVKDVYKVTLKKKLIGRIFGISSITLSTSAGNIKINFLDNQKRESLFNNITYAMKNYGVDNV